MFSSKCFFIISVIVYIFVNVCNGAVFIQPSGQHPDYPGKCYDRLTQRALIPEKEYKPKGICAVMICNPKTFRITIETCPSVEVPNCEQLPPDNKRSYPKCCPKFVCKDAQGKEFIVDGTS